MDHTKQLELHTNNTIDVDGRVDSTGVRFIGEAQQMGDGTWRCLADVGGALCVVEVKIQFEQRP